MNINRLFELAGVNLLLEAPAYDSMITALKNHFPNKVNEIDANINEAKSILKKQDRMVWYIKILRAYLLNDINSVKGDDYTFVSLDRFNNDLFHYYGYNLPEIENIEFKNQNITELFHKLDDTLQKYQKSDKAPVPIQHGDYELIKFPDGSGWWFVDRAYCEEEGRSGKHCGNVLGQHDKSQRILSLRTPNHNVILTFILWSNGFLGEMKAKANQKPNEKYHPQIMQLLLNPIVKGIKGAGYAPWMNFSIFDLSEQNIQVLINHGKESFIIDQIKAEPIDFLNTKPFIKNNPKYQQAAIQALPALKHILNNEKDLKSWETALQEDFSLIIYAPENLKDFKHLVTVYLKQHPEHLIKCPKSVSQNFDILKPILERNGNNIEYVLPNTPKYTELCIIALSDAGEALQHIPKNLITVDMCKAAISNTTYAMRYVPDDLKTFEVCKLALEKSGRSLDYIDLTKFNEKELIELFKITVNSQGLFLMEVPEEYRTYDICYNAVSNNGLALKYVPFNQFNDDEILELCKTAVANHRNALQYVPNHLKEKIKQELNIQESLDLQYFQNL